MKFFKEMFFDSIYKIRLIGIARNMCETALFFNIHNALYVLTSNNYGLKFEKINNSKNLDEFKKYNIFEIGSKEVISCSTEEFFDSNIFGITKDNFVFFHQRLDKVFENEFISHLATIQHRQGTLFTEFDPDDIKIICK